MYFVLRHQKPKQQKTLEKRKNHCVFFWNGIVVGGYAKSTSVQKGQRQQSNVQERKTVKSKRVHVDGWSAVDGDWSLHNTHK